MKKIAIVGTGYVGLVTGVALSDIGHDVTCVDIDETKVAKMNQGLSPIYEPGLAELMTKNIERGNLHFTTDHSIAFHDADAIYIAVGTPERADGSANLDFVQQVARDIAAHVTDKGAVVVTKSTVPVGTNKLVKHWITEALDRDVQIAVVSNPEFLREGSAVHDTYNGDRIVIGSESEEAANLIEEINKPFGVPVFRTDIESAEMIKYASNAFLAAKISFINEIGTICGKLGANIEDVAQGMGMDKRIGDKFLNAGIGYGGSCFPKDTKALVQIAGGVNHTFDLLESVINVNNKQQQIPVDIAQMVLRGGLEGKKVAMLGLAFKPNTDDMRESASIVLAQKLTDLGANISAFDPIAMDNAKRLLPETVHYASSTKEALQDADVAIIVTEWDEFKDLPLTVFEQQMKQPIVIDGRNCYPLSYVETANIDYYSIGRPSVIRAKKSNQPAN
ncbi:UDP-glucose dehydrogenase family protein [Terribacillus saccharophilus]|uniref:UDP-glucose dehydrogenase family protein n=1 Tax=Terribacillus saccharophilus TaxID=361277 RepID=UPI002989CF2B|nr:UDP-glucose/GDP-mannose dehydrogenase family protein [Terribacillus saccharophilus]MCM3226623.1 UDP-glucose/GDP-mannose dehydrogenase family protein [Terribacillus saccharophilus]